MVPQKTEGMRACWADLLREQRVWKEARWGGRRKDRQVCWEGLRWVCHLPGVMVWKEVRWDGRQKDRLVLQVCWVGLRWVCFLPGVMVWMRDRRDDFLVCCYPVCRMRAG